MVDNSLVLAGCMSFRRVTDEVVCVYGHVGFAQFASNLQAGCMKKQEEPNLQVGNCLRVERERLVIKLKNLLNGEILELKSIEQLTHTFRPGDRTDTPGSNRPARNDSALSLCSVSFGSCARPFSLRSHSSS